MKPINPVCGHPSYMNCKKCKKCPSCCMDESDPNGCFNSLFKPYLYKEDEDKKDTDNVH